MKEASSVRGQGEAAKETAKRAPKPGYRAVASVVLLPVLSALLVVLAAPPFGLWPLALIQLVPLYLVVRRATAWRALWIGLGCGFLINLMGFSWAVGLLNRYTGVSPFWGTLVWLLASLYQGTVLGITMGGAAWLRRRFGISWLVGGPLLLAVAESILPMVFPWYLAVTVVPAWPLIQVAEFGGAPAVSALLVLVSLLVAEGGLALRARAKMPGQVRWGAAVVAAIVALGMVRVLTIASAREDAPKLKVAIVQPNFGILSKVQRDRFGEGYIRSLREWTGKALDQGTELVVWPESVLPLTVDRRLPREFAHGHPWELRPRSEGRLLMPALTHDFGPSSDVYNSVLLFDEPGEVRGIYDKNRLLMFSEFIPFSDRFPEWAKRVHAKLPDWPIITPGPGPALLTDGDLRIAPLVCFEEIDSGYVSQMARLGPNLLVTVANHAWFGDGAAARQGKALATLRSVETRRDLVRAASTGVSSIGDALGRVHVEGPVVVMTTVDEADRRGNEMLFFGEVALLEIFALGPYTAPYFSYLCALVLALLVLRSALRRRRLVDSSQGKRGKRRRGTRRRG